MPIVGFTFRKMEADRKRDEISGEIKLDTKQSITEVKEIDVAALGKKTLSLGFEFVIDYAPDVAEIRITGEVLYMSDNENKTEKILEGWNNDKRLPEGVSVDVLNHILRKCLLKSANIAEDLQLPPPLNFPRVKAREK